jgi:Fe2+ transport system protein FeoA
LKAGKIGKVVKLDGVPSLRQHLLEMGFTKGTPVEFIRQAPLGDPIDLRLRGYRLSLRRAEAASIIVSLTE